MASVFSYQPGKTIYAIFAIVFTLARLPLWLVYFAPSSLRPNPNWTFKQAVRVRLLRSILHTISILKVKTPLALEAGKEGADWIVLPPADPSSYIGPTSKDPEITPQKLGCTWYPAALKNNEKPSGYVFLHFHGGAYVIGNGRKEDAGFAAKTLLKCTGASHVFCPQYRLASNAGGRFPSQLQDAVTSYVYLTKQMGVDAKKVVFAGDSGKTPSMS